MDWKKVDGKMNGWHKKGRLMLRNRQINIRFNFFNTIFVRCIDLFYSELFCSVTTGVYVPMLSPSFAFDSMIRYDMDIIE